jgi:hypothetical protein
VIVVAVAWAVGFVLALPFVLWWANDTARIPGRIWFWNGRDPRPWQWAMLLGLVLGGWIAIITAIRWRVSEDRAVLLEELSDYRVRHPGRV